MTAMGIQRGAGGPGTAIQCSLTPEPFISGIVAPPTSYFLFGITKHLIETLKGGIVDFNSGLRRCSPSRQEPGAFVFSHLRRSGKYRKLKRLQTLRSAPSNPLPSIRLHLLKVLNLRK